jgi:hypothetical protein
LPLPKNLGSNALDIIKNKEIDIFSRDERSRVGLPAWMHARVIPPSSHGNTLNSMIARVGARHSHDCNGVHDAIGVARDTINAIAGGVGDTFKSSSGLFSSISLIPEDKPGFIDVGVVSNVNDTGGGNDNNFVSNTVM